MGALTPVAARLCGELLNVRTMKRHQGGRRGARVAVCCSWRCIPPVVASQARNGARDTTTAHRFTPQHGPRGASKRLWIALLRRAHGQVLVLREPQRRVLSLDARPELT